MEAMNLGSAWKTLLHKYKASSLSANYYMHKNWGHIYEDKSMESYELGWTDHTKYYQLRINHPHN